MITNKTVGGQRESYVLPLVRYAFSRANFALGAKFNYYYLCRMEIKNDGKK